MFSVKNKSNIRQVTPYAEFGAFEAKTFYPVSKIYANAKAFFFGKPQFEVWEESLPVEPAKVIPKQEEQKPAPKQEEATVVKPKQEEVILTPVQSEVETKPAEAPVVASKPKARRSLE